MYTAQGQMQCQSQQSADTYSHDTVEPFTTTLNDEKKWLFAQGLVAASRTVCKDATSVTANSKCFATIKNQFNNLGCSNTSFARCDWPRPDNPNFVRPTHCDPTFNANNANDRLTYYYDTLTKVNNFVATNQDARIQAALTSNNSLEGTTKSFNTYDVAWKRSTQSFKPDLQAMYEANLYPHLDLENKCVAGFPSST